VKVVAFVPVDHGGVGLVGLVGLVAAVEET